MRYLRILGLHFEGIFEHRLRSFIWFLHPVVNMLPLILFWIAAFKTNQNIGWPLQYLNSYYLMLIIAMSTLMSHIEEEVGDIDIKEGDLTRYLLKPFSYYWLKMFEEISYRILQGLYGIGLFIVLSIFFSDFFQVKLEMSAVFFAVLSSILAYFLSFTYKMTIGYTAFWLIDNRAVTEATFILSIILAGSVLPLDLFPPGIREVVQLLPFASMIYYPVIIFLGRVAYPEILRILCIQLLWLIFFLVLERTLWKKGIKEFTAMGQ